MAIHPKGDNLLVSTYDKKMLWFDLDLSTKPYQTIRLHKNAVRSVAYHLRYPLFASASDDQSVIVSHGMVYKWVQPTYLHIKLGSALRSNTHLFCFSHFQRFTSKSIDCATEEITNAQAARWFRRFRCCVASDATVVIFIGRRFNDPTLHISNANSLFFVRFVLFRPPLIRSNKIWEILSFVTSSIIAFSSYR